MHDKRELSTSAVQNLRMIDPRLVTLRTFARCGTVAATAELMGYSPSAVSAQLRELQQSLGLTLLTRDGRGLRLTAAGKELVRRSDALFAQWEQIRAASASADGQVPGQFGIGGFSTAASHLIAPLLPRLRDLHPSVEVQVMEASPARCFDLLVAEGFYGNRSDFIRTAIRGQLDSHRDVVSKSLERHTMELGLRDYNRAELEALRDKGEVLHVKVVGLARFAPDVTPELVRATIGSISVLGALQASPDIKAALADRIS